MCVSVQPNNDHCLKKKHVEKNRKNRSSVNMREKERQAAAMAFVLKGGITIIIIFSCNMPRTLQRYVIRWGEKKNDVKVFPITSKRVF